MRRTTMTGCIAFAVLAAAPVHADSLAEPSAIGAGTFTPAVESASRMPRLYSLLISHDGELLLERYFNGRTRYRTANVKSVSKSIMSALVGIAIERGYIEGLDQAIAGYYPDYLGGDARDARHSITIGNLLSMQAGLETTSNRNYGAWVLSKDWVGFALRQPLRAAPGTDMVYSTGNTHVLSDILTKATGESTLAFGRDNLSEPLGFELQPWTRDPNGVYFGGNNMELTPRQMLAFGELYLNEGRANGRQVVPADWVETSLTPRVVSPRDEDRRYGYGWWMRDMAGLPTAYAWGYGGQFILIVRDLGLVVVTTSSSQPGSDRRAHIRGLYRLLEDQVVTPAARAAGLGAGLAAD